MENNTWKSLLIVEPVIGSIKEVELPHEFKKWSSLRSFIKANYAPIKYYSIPEKIKIKFSLLLDHDIPLIQRISEQDHLEPNDTTFFNNLHWSNKELDLETRHQNEPYLILFVIPKFIDTDSLPSYQAPQPENLSTSCNYKSKLLCNNILNEFFSFPDISQLQMNDETIQSKDYKYTSTDLFQRQNIFELLNELLKVSATNFMLSRLIIIYKKVNARIHQVLEFCKNLLISRNTRHLQVINSLLEKKKQLSNELIQFKTLLQQKSLTPSLQTEEKRLLTDLLPTSLLENFSSQAFSDVEQISDLAESFLERCKSLEKYQEHIPKDFSIDKSDYEYDEAFIYNAQFIKFVDFFMKNGLNDSECNFSFPLDVKNIFDSETNLPEFIHRISNLASSIWQLREYFESVFSLDSTDEMPEIVKRQDCFLEHSKKSLEHATMSGVLLRNQAMKHLQKLLASFDILYSFEILNFKYTRELLLYESITKKLQYSLTSIQRFCLFPGIYDATVHEMERRKKFEEILLRKQESLLNYMGQIRKKETLKRIDFLEKFGQIIPKHVFPGIEELIPSIQKSNPEYEKFNNQENELRFNYYPKPLTRQHL